MDYNQYFDDLQTSSIADNIRDRLQETANAKVEEQAAKVMKGVGVLGGVGNMVVGKATTDVVSAFFKGASKSIAKKKADEGKSKGEGETSEEAPAPAEEAPAPAEEAPAPAEEAPVEEATTETAGYTNEEVLTGLKSLRPNLGDEDAQSILDNLNDPVQFATRYKAVNPNASDEDIENIRTNSLNQAGEEGRTAGQTAEEATTEGENITDVVPDGAGDLAEGVNLSGITSSSIAPVLPPNLGPGYSVLSNVAKSSTNMGETAGQSTTADAGSASNATTDAGEMVSNTASTATTDAGDAITSTTADAGDVIASTASSVGDTISSTASTATTAITDTLDTVGSIASDGLTATTTAIGAGLDAAGAALSSSGVGLLVGGLLIGINAIVDHFEGKKMAKTINMPVLNPTVQLGVGG